MTHALLCGTHYGSSYLSVLTAEGTPVRLGGILSRGSAHSRNIARDLGVPHHLSLDELEDGQVDIVIVAVAGPAGVALAAEALKRGFHVLAEHPWEPEDVECVLKIAGQSNASFHINAHWADLKNPAQFVQGCEVARSVSAPAFASLMTNPRTLYSALDLLGRALGTLELSEFSRLSAPEPCDNPFAILQGRIGQTSVTIQYQTFTSQVDDGTSALVNHHTVVGFPHGQLTLAEAPSPALWVPDISQLASLGAQGYSKPASQIFPDETPPTVGEFLGDHRPAANKHALVQLIEHANSGACPPPQNSDYLLNLTRTWRKLINLGGPISYVG